MYQIDPVSRELDFITDRNGNRLQVSAHGITSSTGKHVEFDRDATGRITAVVDPMGKSIDYQYDGNGDLVAVTDREGNMTRFVYNGDHPHFLDEIIDPLGRTGARSEYDGQGRLVRLSNFSETTRLIDSDLERFATTVRDSYGNAMTVDYDERGNVVTRTDGRGGVTRRSFDDHDRVISETGPLDDTTTFTYDDRGNMTSRTDALGHTERFAYGPFGVLVSSTDAVGNTTMFRHDASGNVVSRTDAMGNTTSYAYDAAGNVARVTDPDGNSRRFEYDQSGNLGRQIDALDQVTSFTYDDNGNRLIESAIQTTPTGARTLVTTHQYDANGNEVVLTDPEGNKTHFEYDAIGNQSAITDALGRRSEFVYREAGNLEEVSYADGLTNSFEFDLNNRRIAQIDREGKTAIQYRYDAVGLPTEIISRDQTPDDLNDNPRLSFEYNLGGQLVAMTDPNGGRAEYVYDAAGRPTAARNAVGNEVTSTFDAAGHEVTRTDALGQTLSFAYDALGQRVQTAFPDGTRVTEKYNARGNLIASTNQAGHTTNYEYDALNRLTVVVDPAGGRTEYRYDEMSNLIEYVDANGHATRFEYDGLGRQTAIVRPLGQRSETMYDAIGNIVSATDFNGNTILFEYNEHNQLMRKLLPDGTTEEATYHTNGKPETATDNRGVTTYQYDELGRLASRREPDGTTISYAYNRSGNLETITTPAGTVGYSYDLLNRIHTVADADSSVTQYTYDAADRFVRTEQPNGTVELRTYDEMGRVGNVQHRDANAAVIANWDYTYDQLGNISAVDEDTGRRVEYAYDQLNRLVREVVTDANNGDLTIEYTYDAVGNRLTKTIDVGNDQTVDETTVYTYDVNDRLLTETRDGVVTTYAYDQNGNRLSRFTANDNQVVYEWDAQNRLTGVTVTDFEGTSRIDYTYDVLGNRVAMVADGRETRLLVNDSRELPQVLEEYSTDGTVTASYVYGSRLISQSRGGDKSFYVLDGQNDVRALADESGAITDTYIYDAAGLSLASAGETENVYLFNGEQFDPHVGQYYLRARYYDQNVGRFTSTDPFRGILQNPVSLHRYLFANDNPVSFADPTGQVTALEVAFDLTILGVLATFALSSFQHAVGWGANAILSGGGGTVSWSGLFFRAQAGLPVAPGVSIGVSFNNLVVRTNECHKVNDQRVRVRRDPYLLVMTGVSFGPLPISFPTAIFDDLRTPSGVDVTELPFAGFATYLSGSAIVGVGIGATFLTAGFGLGFSLTEPIDAGIWAARVGLAFAHYTPDWGQDLNVDFGLFDVGIDILGGVSIPLSYNNRGIYGYTIFPCDNTPD